MIQAFKIYSKKSETKNHDLSGNHFLVPPLIFLQAWQATLTYIISPVPNTYHWPDLSHPGLCPALLHFSHWMFTDTTTFTQNFSEQSSVTVCFNCAGHLKFARDERRAWTDTANSETEYRFDSSWQAESLKHHFFTRIPSIIYNTKSLECMLCENDSDYWKTRTLAPAQWEAAALWLFVVRRRTKCCCSAHYLTLNLSFLVLFLRFFLDQLLGFVRREIDEISISCEGLPAMHICAEKRKDKRYHKCI